tara:strand:- start:2390 stop:4180 length:1791 start_codon:yes stop_codon:yes gene_type:complete
MSNKENIFLKSLSILDKKILIFFSSIALSSVLISFVELVGIGFLGTFILFLSDINGFLIKIDKFDILSFLSSYSEKEITYFFLISITVFFILKNSIVFVYLYFFHKFKEYFSYFLSKKIFSKNIEMGYEYFLSQKKSKIIHDIREESVRFVGVFFSFLNIIKDVLLILFLGGSIFVLNWKISIIVFISFIFFSGIIFFIIKKRLYYLGKNLTFFSSNFLKKLYESFNNIKFIKVTKLEKFVASKIFYFQKKVMDTTFVQNIIVSIPRLILEIFAVAALCLAIFLYINSSLPIDNLIPLLSFMALAIIRILPAVAAININLNNITTHIHSLEIINSYLSQQKDTVSLVEKSQIKTQNENINKVKFENVEFKYKTKNSEFELVNLNLELKKNDILGVIGRSGSGKTTFADLLLGLLKPNLGRILINDIELKHNNKKLIKYSYVPQSINLLDDTLYNNIVFGSDQDKIDKDKIDKILSLTDLDNLDKNLYQKHIGEDGIEISGGQKQRIGIARGLYNNPNLLVLDEPTSELDYESEKKVMNNLIKCNIDLIVIIAHRINTLSICNKLLILEKGKMVDFGSKVDILKKYKYLEKYFEEKV